MGKLRINVMFVICSITLFFFIPLRAFAQTVPTPTQGPCTDTAPTQAPNLYQITPGQGSATLYFAPPGGSYTGFIISYGLDANANTYNATMDQGVTSGAITYTVNALTPDSTYYFKVQAINNCATGPFSSVMSTTASATSATASGSASTIIPNNPTGNSPIGTVKTPVTGPEDVVYFGFAGLLLSLGGFGLFLKNT